MAVRGGGLSHPMPSYEGPELDVRVGMPLIQHAPFVRAARIIAAASWNHQDCGGTYRGGGGRSLRWASTPYTKRRWTPPSSLPRYILIPPSGYSCRDAKYASRGVACCVRSVMWTKREAYWICWWCGRCSWLAWSRMENMYMGPSKQRLRMRQATDEEPINLA